MNAVSNPLGAVITEQNYTGQTLRSFVGSVETAKALIPVNLTCWIVSDPETLNSEFALFTKMTGWMLVLVIQIALKAVLPVRVRFCAKLQYRGCMVMNTLSDR